MKLFADLLEGLLALLGMALQSLVAVRILTLPLAPMV